MVKLRNHSNASSASYGENRSRYSDASRSITPSSAQGVDNARKFPTQASIVLIGIRGAGKRSLGFIAAARLGRRFITEGHYYESVTGCSKAEYLQKHDKTDFQRRSLEVFRQLLSQNELGCVIECGMGTLSREVQSLLHEYSHTHPVVYVFREFEHVCRLLKLEDRDVPRLKDWDASHRQYSNLEFYNLYDPSCNGGQEVTAKDFSPSVSFVLRDVKIDFSNFVDFITGNTNAQSKVESPFSLKALPLEQRSYTYATSLNLSWLHQGNLNLDLVESGEDAVELIIDLDIPDLLPVISKQVALIRRKVGVPVIYHVEKSVHGSNPKNYVQLLNHGLRLGVDYLVVEIESQNLDLKQILTARGFTKIIGHHFDAHATLGSWLSISRMAQYERAQAMGCDIVRLVQLTTSREDNADVRKFLDRIDSLPTKHIPLIAYNLGELGRCSQVYNRILTPVKLPDFPVRKNDMTGPALTAKEASQALFHSFELDPLQYFIIGSAISYSLSPAMHNAAYRKYGMDHNYSIHQASNFEEFRAFFEDSHFGGASVTSPYKVDITSQLALKSSHATAIGAINTLIPLRSGFDGVPFALLQQARRRNQSGPVATFYGENTDWMGIVACLRRKLSPRNAVNPSKITGLVIGAGGVARGAIYAMMHLGCQNIFICNRTEQRAIEVANHFNEWSRKESSFNMTKVSVLPSENRIWPEQVGKPTMIVSGISMMPVENQPGPDNTIPPEWLENPSGGVVLDVSSHLLYTFAIYSQPDRFHIIQRIRLLSNKYRSIETRLIEAG